MSRCVLVIVVLACVLSMGYGNGHVKKKNLYNVMACQHQLHNHAHLLFCMFTAVDSPGLCCLLGIRLLTWLGCFTLVGRRNAAERQRILRGSSYICWY